MQRSHFFTLGLSLPLAILLSASVSAQSLTPPAGNTLVLSTFGNGIQIYHSQKVGDSLRWVFSSPSATLYTDANETTPLATHYIGPTWQCIADGSTVAGKSIASVDSPNPSSVPEILLTAKSHSGTGLFSRISFIQRLNTFGGIAPSAPPTQLGQEADVPYKATYKFYAPAAAK